MKSYIILNGTTCGLFGTQLPYIDIPNWIFERYKTAKTKNRRVITAAAFIPIQLHLFL